MSTGPLRVVWERRRHLRAPRIVAEPGRPSGTVISPAGLPELRQRIGRGEIGADVSLGMVNNGINNLGIGNVGVNNQGLPAPLLSLLGVGNHGTFNQGLFNTGNYNMGIGLVGDHLIGVGTLHVSD